MNTNKKGRENKKVGNSKMTGQRSDDSNLDQVLNRINDGIVALDNTWTYTYVNEIAAKLLNREKPEDLIGKNIWQEYPEGINQPFYIAYHKAMEKQEVIFLEEFYQPWNRYFENRIYPSPDGLTIYFSDITEKKLSEKKLLDVFSRFEEAQEIANLGIWQFNLQKEILQWSQEMYHIFGVQKESFSHSVKAFFNLIHPDDRENMVTWIEQSSAGIKPGALDFRIVKPNGEIRWVRGDGKLTLDSDGNSNILIGTALDITERKNHEKEISDKNIFIESILNASPDLIYVYDIEKKINIYVNSSIEQYLGYNDKEIKAFGSHLIEKLMHPEDYSRYLSEILPRYLQLNDNEVIEQDFQMRRKDGQWRWFHSRESIYLRNDAGVPVQIFGLIEDRTEAYQLDQAKQTIEERFKTALENIPDVIVLYDQEKKIRFINKATRKVSGRSESDFLGKTEQEIWPSYVYERYLPTLEKTYETKKSQSIVTEIRFPNDEIHSLRVTCVPILDEEGQIKEVLGITHDFTESANSRKLLEESEERYRLLIETSPYAIGVHQDGKIVFVNKAALKLLGASSEEDLVGKPISTIIDPEGLEIAKARIARMMQGETGLYPAEERYVKLNGEIVPVEVTAVPFKYGGRPAVQVIALDLTEQKITQQKLANEVVRRRVLVEQSRDGIVILDEDGNVYEANLKAAEMLGYTLEEYSKLSVFDWDSMFSTDSLKKMISSVDEKGDHFETVHRKKDGSLLDVEISTNASKIQGEKLIFCVIRDISERKVAQNKLEDTLVKLRRAVETSIKVLIETIEIRDPYTAGHQRRVADLASALAEELGLNSDDVEGIRIAASIHDIGKISVPAEILTKPTRLTDIEMKLVREHAQHGYNILKDVESQWPLAKIVHQHHEKMDGSGYPQGLKGSQIMFEARILCVADVVEAMASHRPYRPAQGIDFALKEIKNQKGILFDAQVVDACLKLFREKRFAFSD